jgi:chorismate-pyruvate lyase
MARTGSQRGPQSIESILKSSSSRGRHFIVSTRDETIQTGKSEKKNEYTGVNTRGFLKRRYKIVLKRAKNM